MKLIGKIRLVEVIGIVVGVVSSVAGLSATAASADSTSSNISSPSSTLRLAIREDKLTATAEAVNMSKSQVQADLKAHDLKQIVTDDGFSNESFKQKVQSLLESELLGQGYSQEQIDNALSHHYLK